MGLPGQPPPPPGPGHGHGPFGDKAFRVALRGCVVLIAIGALMILAGGDDVAGAGTALAALGALGLAAGGGGLYAERRILRRSGKES